MTEHLHMDTKGRWSHGVKATCWTLDPASLRHGWCVFSRDRAVKKILVPLTRARPKRPRRKETQQMVQMVFSAAAETVTYSTASLGGMHASYQLIDAIRARIARGSSQVCPIVRLRSTVYRHKKFGTVYAPDFAIVGWTDFDGDGSKRRRPLLSPSHHAAA